MKQISTLVSVSALAATLSSSAFSAIIATAGQAVQIAPPPSAVYGALPGLPAYCWNEQSGITTTAMNVNIAGPGSYTGAAPWTGVVSGTFDSHIVHFDASSGVAAAFGDVWFSSAIRAVIYTNVLLDNTDATWGAPGTTYPTGDPFRSYGASLWQSVVQVSGNHLHFNLWVGGAAFPNRMGELRVFTDAVPAPGALALCGLAGLVSRRRRR